MRHRLLALHFAAIGVNQLGGGSRRKPDVRPPFCRITGFEWWANHSGGDELVKAAGRALRMYARLDKLSDHAAMRRDRNTLAGFDPPNVAAQVVLEFANACGSHWTASNGRFFRHFGSSTATSHTRPAGRSAAEPCWQIIATCSLTQQETSPTPAGGAGRSGGASVPGSRWAKSLMAGARMTKTRGCAPSTVGPPGDGPRRLRTTGNQLAERPTRPAYPGRGRRPCRSWLRRPRRGSP